MLAEELQPAGLVQPLQFFEEPAPEQPREHAHRQEEARPACHPGRAVRRQPAAGHDAVHVRVVRQRRAPGVQHQRRADAGAQLLGVHRDGLQNLCGHVEQQPVDGGLVGVGDVGDGRWQGEDDVEVLHRQQVGLPGVEPALRGRALALRAVPVAARSGEIPRTCLMESGPLRGVRQSRARQVPGCALIRLPIKTLS